MGLAESTGGTTWLVRRDFEQVLRGMKRMADRQKTLAAEGVLMSDDRLPMTTLEMRDLTSVEGRILVQGEEEVSGRTYLMLEGTDARVYYVYRTQEMEEVRSRGGLKTNSFVRLRKLSTVRGPVVDIQDMGDPEAILRNKRRLREAARDMMKRGVIPQDNGWSGWLGKYQKALRETALALERRRSNSIEAKAGGMAAKRKLKTRRTNANYAEPSRSSTVEEVAASVLTPFPVFDLIRTGRGYVISLNEV
jgi:hypothetical protein